MAQTSPGERIQKYTQKLIPARIATLLTTKKAGMVAKMTAVVARQMEIEARVRGIYATKSTCTMTDPAFLQGFAKRAERISCRFGGGDLLDTEYAALVVQYKAYGCTEAWLLQILNEVFGWTPPAP